jgi:hypothetical protein
MAKKTKSADIPFDLQFHMAFPEGYELLQRIDRENAMIKGMIRALLIAGEKRLGPAGEQVRFYLDCVTNDDVVEQLLKELFDVTNWYKLIDMTPAELDEYVAFVKEGEADFEEG